MSDEATARESDPAVSAGTGYRPDRGPLPARTAAVLVGGNEMGELMRAHDWASSPVGPVESWPQSLRTALNILLDSRYPMYIAWGPEFVQFYNDGYRPILGATKHPAALGRSTRETFAEIWDFIGPMFEEVMRSGRPTYLEDQILPLDRNGYVEECYFTFCYSAVRTESGDVGGVFVTCSETTPRVIGERRLHTLRDLGATSTTAQDVRTAVARAAQVLDRNPTDVPFSLIYLVDDAGEARLAVRTGIAAEHPAATPTMALGAAANPAWPVAGGAAGLVLVDDLARRFGVIPSRSWPEPVTAAAVVPINRSAQHGTLDALLVVGLNPRRAFDDDYRAFVGLVAGQIGAAIAAARAYEEERQRAQALAELDRAKTTFFSNVSHEFRTPLTLMLGPIEDLLQRPASPLAPADRAKLELLQRNGLRLLKLVNTLLDFARIEAGRVQASFEPVELARVTVDLASAFRAAVERAGMRLVVDCADVGEPVFVDTSMWEKIVLNLLSNAFKFTFAGEIRVALERVEAERCARLTVTDTGVGIAPDELPHVFERFRRVEGVRARAHEGSGIGLALVQELVRLHGGHVRVASTVGVGTTFTVDLPLGHAHLPADRIRATRTGASTALGAAPFVEEALRWLPDADGDGTPLALPVELPDADGRPGAVPDVAGQAAVGARPRVLVVDDNADMRTYLADLLRAHYEVDLATDGGDALERARRRRPDLVLSDVMMPVLDGFALIEALRADPETAAVPVILLSARAGEESTVEGLGRGADDYLVKPFAARELLARVRAHLQFSEAIHRERARLVALFDQAPAFMAVLKGPDHVFDAANAAYLSLIGRADVIGKPLLEALPEISDQGYRELLDRVYATGVPYVGREERVMLVRAPGEPPEESFLSFVYQPMLEPDGRVSGVFVQGIDVTAQVRARQEVERLYESVKEANEAKRQFLAAMSHELRTPLNAVIGYADLLALGVRGPLTDGQRADLERIRSASQYLLVLITDILNFSRVEAGQVELRPAAIRVEAVLRNAGELMQPHIESRGIHFVVVPPDPTLELFADQERLQQILLNLLMNASKFTPSGGRIRLWAESRAAAVHLCVEDTGVGIPATELAHVFEPFVQLDRRARRESQQGVGLGLAISRDLARRMGGDVLARSEPGHGSCFTVILPHAPRS
ncbi:MAG TPA: ATP-binding protein [Gemmatimonadaceae bacterium]|nr:ATP-binding protein [Gemmatimonadaceae bacterium]